MIKNRLSVILPVIFLAALVISNGCAKRVSTSQLDETGTKSSQPSVDVSKPEPRKGEDLIAIAEPLIPSAEVSENVLSGEPLTETPMSSAKYKEIRDIFFDFDQYAIRDDARGVLQNNASVLKKKNSKKIIIEGYCDDRGTNEYNLALGERRAQSTKRYLAALGINPSDIATISYGEEKPFCSDQNEECRQQNRRAHFMVE